MNLSALVPNPVQFECDSRGLTSVYLRKNNVNLVHAKIENSTVYLNSSAFKTIYFVDKKIVFNLLKSNLNDEGKYSCAVINQTRTIIGNSYLLKVFGKLTCVNFHAYK